MDKTYKSDVQLYPWDGKFETKTEIDDYLARNEIQCLLCGKWFKALPTHIERTHGITAGDYRERFGLPWDRGLCGTGPSKKLSKNMLERQKNGFQPPIEDVREKSVTAKKTQDQPILVEAKIDTLKSCIEKIKKYARQDFKNVLVKMLKEKKGLYEACKDAGMPHFGAVSKYAKKNAEYRKELEKTYEQLPDSVQTGASRFPEKKIIEGQLIQKRQGITKNDEAQSLNSELD